MSLCASCRHRMRWPWQERRRAAVESGFDESPHAASSANATTAAVVGASSISKVAIGLGNIAEMHREARGWVRQTQLLQRRGA